MSAISGESSAPLGDKYKEQWKALGAWFLGPRGENGDIFLETFKEIFQEHIRARKNFFPSDPAYINEEIKSSHAYQSEIKDMKQHLLKMLQQMKDSALFFSPRYKAHMDYDASMPALLGYMGAMLYHQNNGDTTTSPVTTVFEQKVGLQLCDMLGYNIYPDKDKPVAWGHVTSGGSGANIEAIWASRNIKFLPIAVKAALLNISRDSEVGTLTFLSPEQVQSGLMTPLLVYNSKSRVRENTPLKECTEWQLLNVDIDEICDLKKNVIRLMKRTNPHIDAVDEKRFFDLVEREGIKRLGLGNFLKRHGIEQSPVFTAPANNHYSFQKAATLLGLGSDALAPISIDIDFRQDLCHLKRTLENFLKNKSPVISVVVVMGSTEQSSVDPIADILKLREEFKGKGLNFAIVADAAWGGYFKTMLIDGPSTDNVEEDEGCVSNGSSSCKFDGFVPYCELTPYVQKQYEHIQFADTISIDPHKAGFCPYPGGGLCYRNEKMRYPIALSHPEVYHGEGDPNMAVYGIQGSKAGAASAGILMAHNVIGLSNRGYGRILGQCNTITKIFYTMWLTVARHDDPFVCVPLQDIPEGYDTESTVKLIKDKIAQKPLTDIYQDRDAMQFLKLCGPDTLINTVVVNLRDNDDVTIANKLQVALGDAMNVFVGTNASRVPLMIMQSSFDAMTHGRGLETLKKKAGLRVDDTDLNVLCNTCMNPWTLNESISDIGDLFRNIVLNCIGRIKDFAVTHRFFLSGSFDDKGTDNSIFIEYLTSAEIPERQYQVSLKVEANNEAERRMLSNYILYCEGRKIPAIFETVTPKYDEHNENVPNLYNILHLKDWGQQITVKLINDAEDNAISLKVLDLPRFQRLDMSTTVTYPEQQRYFLYGDSTRIIMSHVISKLPDFQHTVRLSGRPHSMSGLMQDLGVMVNVGGVQGSPLEISGKMRAPLQRSSYEISFIGEFNATLHTTINIKDTVLFNAIPPPATKAYGA